MIGPTPARRGAPPAGEAVADTYVERFPPARLAGIVASMWVQHVPPGAPPLVHRNIPSGSVELRCRLGHAPRVVGPLTRPDVEVLPPGATVVGLRVRPAAAARVVTVPASELADLTLAADELWHVTGAALGEAVGAAATADDALDHLVRHVARVLDPAPPDPLARAAVAQLRRRSADVRLLARTLHVSERQLRRRVTAAVGLPPKALHRTLRFQGFLAEAQHAIANGRAPAADGLARRAVDAGYADQAHLTRECVRLAGLTPSALLATAERTCACGHDHAASFAPLLRSRPPG